MTMPAPAKPRPGRPSKEEAAETSNRIIDTAAELFAAQGFAATSMEQVATACGAGKDTIYRRFSSKADLFAAVVERLRARTLERLEVEIEAAGGAGDALSKVRRIARWFLTVNLDPDMVALKRIALSESVVFGGGKQGQSGSDPIMTRLVALVSEAQAAHMLADGDPQEIAAHLLHSIVFGPSNDAMLGRSTYATKAAQDRYFDKAWGFFLHGAAAR